MAVVVTVASGFDLGYVWKNQAGRAEPERSAGGYYINAAQAGEPPGRWWGPGAEALGFAQGQEVERRPYELVYRQVDPRTGQKLGRSRGCYATFADHLARLQAAEPHATAERLLELEREAAQATRQSPAYTDVTVSFSKSISVFHASIRENERQARLAGDEAEAARWAAAERRYQEVLHAANRAGLEYVQRWAGISRTGYHGTRVADQEPGRFEEGLITVTSWLQGTSRDGDPQDHIHNQIARMVKTVSDGKYRALDTVCLRQVIGAVQAVVATHAECGLTREFGVGWVPRTDGAGHEIAGITQQQMDAYSSRTVAITERMPEAVASWTAKYGRAPNRRELLYIRQEVTMASRDGKDAGVIDWDALTARWDAQLGGALASIAPRVSALRARADASAASRGDADARTALSRADLTRVVQRALTQTQAARSTWTRSDLLKQLALVLPPQTRTLAPSEAVALLHQLADEALAGSVEQVICLEAPLPASQMDAPGVVAAYKNLRHVEWDFRHIKSDDLELRPVWHHLEERVRAHVLICMLACYLTWHLRRAWAPLTFTDEDPPVPVNPVTPARRSPAAQAKASYQRDQAGQPYRSFRGLLEHLATLTRNQVRFAGTPATVPMLAEPTSTQRDAFTLIGAPIPLTLR